MAQDQPKLQLAGAHILKQGASAAGLLEFVLRAHKFFEGEGLADITIGNIAQNGTHTLPNGTSAENQSLGRRYVLAWIQDGRRDQRAALYCVPARQIEVGARPQRVRPSC